MGPSKVDRALSVYLHIIRSQTNTKQRPTLTCNFTRNTPFPFRKIKKMFSSDDTIDQNGI